MINRTIVLMGVMFFTATCFGAETSKVKTEPKVEDSKQVEIVPTLPKKNSTEYWVVRSQAMTEFIPFLSKKRTEIKKIRLLLADYLLKIDKADDFAARKMPVVYNAELYADILRIKDSFVAMNMEIPKERPSWDALVEIVMQHILFEGYMPTDIEEGPEVEQYIALCKKKEEYGNKVRNDARSILDQTAKMWVYLDQNKKLDDFKAYELNPLLFNSLKKPAIIFLMVPLAIVGVTIGLLVTGQPFGFMALLGFLSLMGMLIKNAIVLIDEINMQMSTGKDPFTAIVDSGVSRVRPVSLAALTTVLGMIPLLADAFFAAMAVTIMFGLTFATVLTLIVVPVLYASFFKIKPA